MMVNHWRMVESAEADKRLSSLGSRPTVSFRDNDPLSALLLTCEKSLA